MTGGRSHPSLITGFGLPLGSPQLSHGSCLPVGSLGEVNQDPRCREAGGGDPDPHVSRSAQAPEQSDCLKEGPGVPGIQQGM